MAGTQMGCPRFLLKITAGRGERKQSLLAGEGGGTERERVTGSQPRRGTGGWGVGWGGVGYIALEFGECWEF